MAHPTEKGPSLAPTIGMELIYWLVAAAVIASVIAFTMKRKQRAGE